MFVGVPQRRDDIVLGEDTLHGWRLVFRRTVTFECARLIRIGELSEKAIHYAGNCVFVLCRMHVCVRIPGCRHDKNGAVSKAIDSGYLAHVGHVEVTVSVVGARRGRGGVIPYDVGVLADVARQAFVFESGWNARHVVTRHLRKATIADGMVKLEMHVLFRTQSNCCA